MSAQIICVSSIMLGIVASVMPNLVFAKIFWRGTKNEPRQVVRSLYWGKAINYILLIVLISLCLQWSKLNSVAFFWSFLLFELARLLRSWFSLPRVEVK